MTKTTRCSNRQKDQKVMTDVMRRHELVKAGVVTLDEVELSRAKRQDLDELIWA